jgi:hypothetical protein
VGRGWIGKVGLEDYVEVEIIKLWAELEEKLIRKRMT